MPTVRLKPVLSNTIQVGYTASPTGTALLSAIARQPGAIWLIGNEPDCNAMDNMRSEWYARAYHDVYYFIKAADPTAKIAAGNIVQPTRQRFMYLNNVLATYQAEYGEPLPTDLWSIHSYILCEKCYPYNISSEPFAWGACWVPDWPSRTASEPYATFYSVYDHWNMDIFTSRIETFRQWMYDNGYRNHPLIIPEYGILSMKIWSAAIHLRYQNREFMYAGFDWMLVPASITGYRLTTGDWSGLGWFRSRHGIIRAARSLIHTLISQQPSGGILPLTALLTPAPANHARCLHRHSRKRIGALNVEPETSVTAVNYRLLSGMSARRAGRRQGDRQFAVNPTYFRLSMA